MNTTADVLRTRPSDPGDGRATIGAAVGALSVLIIAGALVPFRDHLPYVLAYVELEEGPRVLTNVVGCEPADVRIGLPVVADFATSEAAYGDFRTVGDPFYHPGLTRSATTCALRMPGEPW